MLQCSLFPQSKTLKRSLATSNENSPNTLEDGHNFQNSKSRKASKSNASSSPAMNDTTQPDIDATLPNFDWQKLSTMPPCDFLQMLLKSRGFSSQSIDSDTVLSKRPMITNKQLEDYDHKFLSAVRSSDLSTLKLLQSEGKSMLACNRYGESVLHLACRSGTAAIVSHMLQFCEDISHVDDYGRNLLHDACWRSEPSFEIITSILDRSVELIRSQDVRGHTPLDYVPRDQWGVWCAFLYVQKERYWPKSDKLVDPASSIAAPIPLESS